MTCKIWIWKLFFASSLSQIRTLLGWLWVIFLIWEFTLSSVLFDLGNPWIWTHESMWSDQVQFANKSRSGTLDPRSNWTGSGLYKSWSNVYTWFRTCVNILLLTKPMNNWIKKFSWYLESCWQCKVYQVNICCLRKVFYWNPHPRLPHLHTSLKPWWTDALLALCRQITRER